VAVARNENVHSPSAEPLGQFAVRGDDRAPFANRRGENGWVPTSWDGEHRELAGELGSGAGPAHPSRDEPAEFVDHRRRHGQAGAGEESFHLFDERKSVSHG